VSNVLFTAFANRGDATRLAGEAALALRARGVSADVATLDERLHPSASTLLVSMGGDGTFLRSARVAHASGARILAVNLGRVGFLLDVPAEEVVDAVVEALSHHESVARLALDIAFEGDSGCAFALNEVVVERKSPGHMVRVATFVDTDEFLTYSADGVMVSTPTGSTGYNFSAGGPVVDASLDVMIVTPIAPHFTIDRSIVVPGSRTIRLVANDKPALVVADATMVGTLEPGQSVTVRQSATPVRVVQSRSFEMGFRLRENLREGHA
jgi:NAD+ kinase